MTNTPEDDRLRHVEIQYEIPALAPGEPAPPRPDGTPDDVKIRWSAPAPVIAERAGLDVNLPEIGGGEYKHRLVTIGDSITQGFKSAAIAETMRSWPMIVAYELGLRAAYTPGEQVADPEFTFPTFPGPPVAPGMPMNIEWMLRAIEAALPDKTLRLNEIDYGSTIKRVARQVAEYWERGDGAAPLPPSDTYHDNLAVFGHDVRDLMSKSRGWSEAAMHPANAHISFLREFADQVLDHVHDEFVTSYTGERATIRTLWGPEPDATQLSAARSLGEDGGIETLVVMIGANNALRAVTDLQIRWSGTGFKDLTGKAAYNVWRPTHFEQEFGELMDQVRGIKARHVIWATVPHVTVVPLLRGVGEKPYYSRYFLRYTRPWITDENFDASVDPYLTGDEARAIDSAIDQYNYFIKRQVRDARQNEERSWYLLDICGLLDRLAYRRYLNSPRSQPAWFAPYPLPAELRDLRPRPDTRFFRTDVGGRLAGGLIALDGVHPTTVGYGIVAQEIVTVMSAVAQVPFRHQDGMSRDEEVKRDGTVKVDFARLIAQDTLISRPPMLLDESLRAIEEINKVADLCRLLAHKA